MATLSAAELQAIRNRCAERPGAVTTLTKAQVNAGAQACEDFLTNNAAAVSSAIDAAISPGTLNAAGKKKLFAEVVEAKYQRDK
jgi:hypothetical protein